MEISEELKSRILSDFNLVRDEWENKLRSESHEKTHRYSSVPFYSGRVIDFAIFDHDLGAFVKIEAFVGDRDPVMVQWGKDVHDEQEAHFNPHDIKVVAIPLA